MEGGKYILKCGWLRDKPITHNSNKTSLKLPMRFLLLKVVMYLFLIRIREEKKKEETLQKRKKK